MVVERPRVAIILGRDVNVGQIAQADPSGADDTVCDLLIHADAGRSGKPVDQLWSRMHSGRLHELPPNLIEFARGDAGLYRLANDLKNVGNDASDLLEPY